tara:strand:- start:359 stop:727 length:369 start_codon:yes stop_codon:yes gene_type:complete
MPRGRKKRNRLRAKRFEEEIITATKQILETLDVSLEEDSDQFRTSKSCIGKMIKRLLDTKMLREQEFYLGDWVFTVKDKSVAAVEIIDINYKLRTARIKDKKEGEIWVKFNDIIKDDDFYYV